jgi:hypothetical protein
MKCSHLLGKSVKCLVCPANQNLAATFPVFRFPD